MSEQNFKVTRRDFLKGAAMSAMAATMGLPEFALAQEDKPLPKSRVILVRDENAINVEGQIDAKIIHRMLNEAMIKLTDAKDSTEAWKKLFSAKDIIGIKSNVWGPLPTPPELEQALISELKLAGVEENNIAVDDRGVLSNEVFQNSTALINVRPLRTHHWSGIGGCLKNPIMFSDKPWSYHDNSCADLAKVWELPGVKDKVRLNILVMLTPLFYGVGAHHFDIKYTWPYKGLLVSTDPVSVDSIGVDIFNAKRKEYFDEDKPIAPPPHHIVFAETRHKLGIASRNNIELIKLGYEDGALI